MTMSIAASPPQLRSLDAREAALKPPGFAISLADVGMVLTPGAIDLIGVLADLRSAFLQITIAPQFAQTAADGSRLRNSIDQRWESYVDDLREANWPQIETVESIWNSLRKAFDSVAPRCAVVDDDRAVFEWRRLTRILSVEVDRHGNVLWFARDLEGGDARGNEDPEAWEAIQTVVGAELANLVALAK